MKSAGYKLSALEFESVLLESPLIAEAAVLGVPDDAFGEVVSALAAAKGELAESAVLDHCATRLAKYKTPRRFLFLDALPRNAMGKVNKKQLVKLFASWCSGALPMDAVLGRISVDIMKSAGYKPSALEIELVLLELIAEAAVLCVPDDTFGEVVSALIVPSAAAKGELAESAVLDHCATRLAKYKTPRRFLFLDALPRNAMGKVNKKQLVKLFA
eukprot:gene10903-16768_t